MNRTMNAEQYEKLEPFCQVCRKPNSITSMVLCHRCYEDIEGKEGGINYICKKCCELKFATGADSCICYECCENEDQVLANIKLYFEKCVNIEGLTKRESKNNVSLFANNENTLCITPNADKLLEQFRPLNIVINSFSDNEGEILYIKDNYKRIISYRLNLFEEEEERFSVIRMKVYPEMFSTPEGFLCIVYQLDTSLSLAAMIKAERIIEDHYVYDLGVSIATKFKNRYSEAEAFFGVEVNPDKKDLKEQIQMLSEAELISVVLVPILKSLGFQGVQPISFHGPGENGSDFHPFYKTNEFGKIIYYSAQAKAVKIHSKAGLREGNVNQLIDQMKKAFRSSFKSFIDNSQRRITYTFIFCSQNVANEAREQLFHEIENGQMISLIEIDEIIDIAVESRLAEQILNYCHKKRYC